MTILIFEGSDNTGKSTSAQETQTSGEPTYNLTKEKYAELLLNHRKDPSSVWSVDRVDWLTHMVYRLGMPGYEWYDERVRTVFTMPDSHLIIKAHYDQDIPDDELYDGKRLLPINTAYVSLAHHWAELNKKLGFTLFKSVSLVIVRPEDNYRQLLYKVWHSKSPEGEQPHVELDNLLLAEYFKTLDQEVN